MSLHLLTCATSDPVSPPSNTPLPLPAFLTRSFRMLKAHSPYSRTLLLSNLPSTLTAAKLEVILDGLVPAYITDGGSVVGVVRDGMELRGGRGAERGKAGLRMVRLYEAPQMPSEQRAHRGVSGSHRGGRTEPAPINTDSYIPPAAQRSGIAFAAASVDGDARRLSASGGASSIRRAETSASARSSSSSLSDSRQRLDGQYIQENGIARSRSRVIDGGGASSSSSVHSSMTRTSVLQVNEDEHEEEMWDSEGARPRSSYEDDDNDDIDGDGDGSQSAPSPVDGAARMMCAELIFDAESHHYLAKHALSRILIDGQPVQAHTKRWRVGYAMRRLMSI